MKLDTTFKRSPSNRLALEFLNINFSVEIIHWVIRSHKHYRIFVFYHIIYTISDVGRK